MSQAVPDSVFEALLAEHKDAVYRQMVRVCGNRDDADDALSEAILRAYQASASLEHPEAFRVWLATIGRRVCGRIRRKNEFFEWLEHDGAVETTKIEAEMALMKGCIESAMQQLSPEAKEVFQLRDLEGMSGEAVADRLGITLAAQKSRLHRARQELREFLDEGICGREGL